MARIGRRSDELLDGDDLLALVVEELEFRQTDEDGHAVPQLVAHLPAASDDLLGWDPVEPLRYAAHELDATTRDDVGF